MKNKQLIILFLVFLILIFPFEKASAFGWEDVKNGWDSFKKWASETWEEGGGFTGIVTTSFFWVLATFIEMITWLIHQLLWFINIHLIAPIINFVSQFTPFEKEEKPNAPAFVLWNILTSFAYILLVFSALAAAYEWLFGEDATAKRLIFHIILVALIISFTYVLVKETFLVVKSIEDGITGGQAGQIGSILVASMWPADPFASINEIAKNMSQGAPKYIFEAIGYIFIIVFDMLILLILAIAFILFIARYIIMIFLAATSSIAVATLTFPEFKNIAGLQEVMSQFRVFNTWLDYFVRWLLIIPIFVILVILGNMLKANVIDQLANLGIPIENLTNPGATNNDPIASLVQFIVIFFVIASWYIMSIIIANRISKGTAALAKGLAAAALLTVGGAAAKGLMTATQGKVGGILKKAGGKIEKRVGMGGRFGWRSWVGQKIGARTREIGEKMIKKRYGLEAELVKTKIGNIEEQLRKTTDPVQIQNLTSQISQLVQQSKGNDYILKSINESIKKMPSYSASKILASAENLKAFASPDVPQETREAVIGLVDKLKKGDLKKMAGNAAWLDVLKKISPDVADAFVDKIGKELKETDSLEIISKNEIMDLIPQLPENLRKTLNSITKEFINAILDKNIENISNAMASWDKDIWVPENTEKINNILRSQLSEDEIKASILETIRKTENRGAIIRGALREAPGGPLRTILGRLTDKERDDLKRFLTPQDQATLEAIRGVIIP
jgi:hypothetical protein